MRCFCQIALISIMGALSLNGYAKVLWSNNSLALLYGTTYKVPFTANTRDTKRFVITFEHMSDNSWGDWFSFLDIIRSVDRGRPNALYGELQPRFSLYQMLKKKPETGFLTDVLLATTIEYGASANGFNQINWLIGPGFSFKVPGFQMLRLNFYRRHNQRYKDNWQLTPAWIVPWSLGSQDFDFSGWLDIASKVQNRRLNLHTQIQIKWDAGKSLFSKEKTFYLGTEFKYWRNKFGISGVTERVWQLLAIAYF